MATFKRWLAVSAPLLVTCLILSGCIANKSVRTNPELATKARQIRKIAIAPPDVKAYEVAAGGVPELMDTWSAQATENVIKALQAHLGGAQLQVILLEKDDNPELKEVLALFPAVSYSIKAHTYPDKNPDYFPDCASRFDYSLGSLEALLAPSGADALLLVVGVDQFATSGKKALNVLGAVTGAVAAAFTGIVIVPRGEGTVLQLALADRSGTILWFNIKGGQSDLRVPATTAAFVREALDAFPRPAP